LEINDFIAKVCTDLEKAGVQGVPEYKRRLTDNSTSIHFKDFLLEGRAAFMFRKAGFVVTLREAPDLVLEFDGEQFYAEVKHFKLKKQDSIDDANMRETDDILVPYGDTVPTEDKPAWEQVFDVAKSKKNQYKENASNILVIESDSDCIDDLITPDAVDIVDEAICTGECPGLGRLNGILLVLPDSYNISQKRNAFFYSTSKPDVPLTLDILNLLSRIRLG